MWTCSSSSTGRRGTLGLFAYSSFCKTLWAAKWTSARRPASGRQCLSKSSRRPSVSHDNWQDRVQHILDAIAEIATFIGGMSCDEFLADAKTLKAVTANLTIIGEAARHIPNQ